MREGPGQAFQAGLHRAYSAWWERRLGVRTAAGSMHLADEGHLDENFHDYSPSSCLDLRRALDQLGRDVSNDVFIDYGSGLGRVVLFAAGRPFRRVIGVELSARMNAVALRNLEIARGKLACRDVQLLERNALEYELPPDVTVVYFYNPFGGEVLRGVIANIRRSIEAAPRRVTMITATPPRFEEAVAGERWLRKTAAFHGLRRHSIYEAGAPAA